jgi:hypothetical protein
VDRIPGPGLGCGLGAGALARAREAGREPHFAGPPEYRNKDFFFNFQKHWLMFFLMNFDSILM